MIHAMALLTKQMDRVKYCLEFVDHRVPDVTTGIQINQGL
jgi:hypothetical protein